MMTNRHLCLPGNITLNDGDIFNQGLHRNSLSSLAMNVTCTGRYDNKNKHDDNNTYHHIKERWIDIPFTAVVDYWQVSCNRSLVWPVWQLKVLQMRFLNQ